VIRQDRELLAELARLNSDVTPLAMRIIDHSVTAAEQHEFADRLEALGRWFHERANGPALVIQGEIVTTGSNGDGRPHYTLEQ
jgi:hypothetical protein